MVLLGAELHLQSLPQTPRAARLRQAPPGARACPLHLLPVCTAPAPACQSHPRSSKLSWKGKACKHWALKYGVWPRRLARLVEIPRKQSLLWPCLPNLGRASTAWALRLLILLKISNLGPILPLQLDFNFFLKAENTKGWSKTFSLQPASLVVPQICPIHLSPSLWQCLHWTLICYASRSTALNTLGCFWKPKQYRFRHWMSDSRRSKCCIWIKLTFGSHLYWNTSVAADAFYSSLPDSGSRA